MALVEVVLVVCLVALVLWVVAGSRKAAARDRLVGLQNWEGSDDHAGVEGGVWVNVNFVSMKALRRVAGAPYERKTTTDGHEVRRTDGGLWEWRLDEPTYKAMVDDLRKDIADPTPNIGRGIAKDSLAHLEKEGRQWKAMPEAWQPSLETAYQRYVRQG